MSYYAHSNDSDDCSSWQLLDDHLNNVADLAAESAAVLDASSWGRALGLLHDLGKVRPAFQKRLEGSSQTTDHSTFGALHALNRYGSLGELMSLCIAGHHGGIPNYSKDSYGRTCLKYRIEKDEPLDRLGLGYVEARDILLPSKESLENELRAFVNASYLEQSNANQAGTRSFAFTRFAFSCLVDADYLDTEHFMAPDLHESRAGRRSSSVAELLDVYSLHMTNLEAGAAGSEVNRYRMFVRKMCIDKAELPTGIFELSVETGGGKTLASMGFALRHALANGLDRVIFAIPFTSIVEQTASVLRSVFGDCNVLEHHSNYDFESLSDEQRLSERLACENWDSPIVVTTNVQLFESLFSNKPSKSRKVHNIANSVIVLDEVQSLPDSLLKPTLAMIETVATSFGSSVVLCTATQPALDGVWPYEIPVTKLVEREAIESGCGEVCSDDVPSLSPRTSFIKLDKPGVDDLLGIDDLAVRIADEKEALCIVGKKSEALDIYRRVRRALGDCPERENRVFCLTTYMTPEHRLNTLEIIRHHLDADDPCIVISTQLIEAGVDVDFPVVFRELAGIDSLYQAAGRCNREGRREGTCPVYVFEVADDEGKRISTTPWLEKLKDISRMLIGNHEGNLDDVIDDSMVNEFFNERYGFNADLDDKKILPNMEAFANPCGIRRYECATISNDYKFIESPTVPVFVRWGDASEELYQAIRKSAYPATLTRAAQRFSIGIMPNEVERLRADGAIEEIEPFLILEGNNGCRKLYDDETGFCSEGEEELLTLTI